MFLEAFPPRSIHLCEIAGGQHFSLYGWTCRDPLYKSKAHCIRLEYICHRTKRERGGGLWEKERKKETTICYAI